MIIRVRASNSWGPAAKGIVAHQRDSNGADFYIKKWYCYHRRIILSFVRLTLDILKNVTKSISLCKISGNVFVDTSTSHGVKLFFHLNLIEFITFRKLQGQLGVRLTL